MNVRTYNHITCQKYFEQQFVKNLTRPLSDYDDSKNSFGQYRLSFDHIRNRNI